MEDTLIGRIIKIISLNKELSQINRDVNKLIKLRKSTIFSKQVDEYGGFLKISASSTDIEEMKKIEEVLLCVDKKFRYYMKCHWKTIAMNSSLVKPALKISNKINNEKRFYKMSISYEPINNKNK